MLLVNIKCVMTIVKASQIGYQNITGLLFTCLNEIIKLINAIYENQK